MELPGRSHHPSGDTAGDRVQPVTPPACSSAWGRVTSGKATLAAGTRNPASAKPGAQPWVSPCHQGHGWPLVPKATMAGGTQLHAQPGAGERAAIAMHGRRHPLNPPASHRPCRLINPHPAICKAACMYANQGVPPLVAPHA